MSTVEAPYDLDTGEPRPEPPVPRTPAVEAGLARLVTQFRRHPRIEAVLRSLLSGVQDVEDAIESLRNGRAIGHAVGAQLDGIGQIVGLPRGAMEDPEYRQRLAVQIRINLATGSAEDILQILALILGPTSGIQMVESQPAELRIVVHRAVPHTAGRAAAAALRQTKPAGVSAWLEWGEDPARNFCFEGGPGLGFDEGEFADVEAS